MIRNYIKTAFRNITKNTVYSFINIAGLSVGLTAFILIALWIQHELSYDRFHEKAHRIYRVVQNGEMGNKDVFSTFITPAPLIPHLKENFADVENAFRVRYNRFLFTYGEKIFNEEGILADPAILDVLSIPCVKGDPKTALRDVNSIVLTEKLANKYFPDEDAIGKVLRIQNTDLAVTAIIANVPENTHLQFDFILPFELVRKFGWDNFTNWRSNIYSSYVLLREKTSLNEFNAKIINEIDKNAEGHDTKTEIYVQPLVDIHLFSSHLGGDTRNGNIQYIYIFSSVAIFILIIACINFMNLSTARSLKRAKEIGMRKCIGAARTQLIVQFLSESLMLSMMGLVLSVVAVTVLLPSFNDISGKQLNLDLSSFKVWSVLLGISVVTGLIAGSYPALFLSSFKPIKALKGTFNTGLGAVRFRHTLVVIQFSLSIILITGTILVYDQLHFIRNKDLGFEKENTIVFWKWGMHNNYENFKDELLDHAEIADVTVSSGDLTSPGSARDDYDWEGKAPGKNVLINQLIVDYNFIKAFKIDIAEGRDFSEDQVSDSLGFILNEEAVRKIGMEDPVGKRFAGGTIIGVVKDFHFRSMHEKIEPIVLFISRNAHARIAVKLRKDNIEQGVATVEATYKKFIHDRPFEYTFMKDDLDHQYRTEHRTGKIFNCFAFIAIFISCLGLFGLVMFATEQRTKEIGVRKVLGASVRNVVFLISSDFTKIILIANAIAIPMAWYAMNRWMGTFAYHVAISWTSFAVASACSILIAGLTISYQSIKSATANPVNSLRNE